MKIKTRNLKKKKEFILASVSMIYAVHYGLSKEEKLSKLMPSWAYCCVYRSKSTNRNLRSLK